MGWEYVGQCAGTVGPTASPTLNPGTVIIAGCPADYQYDSTANKMNYMAGSRVAFKGTGGAGSTLYKNVYACREFPYSGYCNQKGFSPDDQYGYMAWTLLGPCEGTLTPTASPIPYGQGGSTSCTYTKLIKSTSSSTSTTTTTPVTTPVETWKASTLYEAGDQVRVGAKKFQCKPWPFYMWCRMSAYAPSMSATGLWTEAWTVAGTCPGAAV